MEEFVKAIREYKLGIEESEVQQLFKLFDTDRSGQLDYNEFLRSIRVNAIFLSLFFSTLI